MVSVEEAGGEFALISRLSKIIGKPKNRRILKGIGDDCAVIKFGKEKWVWTVDCLVEGDHFNFDWFSPRETGMKAIEINASDIYSMNAKPKFALVSLILPKGIKVELLEEIYLGMKQAAKSHSLEIIGGNITHGQKLAIDVTMLGVSDKPVYRSGAKPGDFLCVSGELGASCAGLNLYLQKKKGFEEIKKAHTQPKAQSKKALALGKFVNAMTDVSDGLASEARNIASESKCAVVMYHGKIPVSAEVGKAAHALKMDAVDFALFGGEDFELAFAVSPKNLKKVKGFIVGEFVKGSGVFLESDGKRKKLKRFGYDHFREETKPKGLY